MISDGSYEELVCGLSNDKHYLNKPIVLTDCGHAACRNCLPKETENAKCKICNQKINRNLENDKIPLVFNLYLKNSIENLTNVIERQTQHQINRLRSKWMI